MNRIALILLSSVLAVQAADTTRVAARDAHRARIDAAIASRDYQAWKSEQESWGGKGRVAAHVTQENFDTYARMREAAKAGRVAEAQELRRQLGVEDGRGGAGYGRHGEMSGSGAGKGQRSGRGQGGGGGARCGR
jgi:cell division protein FtsL